MGGKGGMVFRNNYIKDTWRKPEVESGQGVGGERWGLMRGGGVNALEQQ